MYKKRYHLKSRTRKIGIALLSGVMALSLGLAAACTTTDDNDDSSSGETTSSTTDKQTILNGNFEFFGDSEDKTHIIYTPDSWTASAAGRTNYVMNGIINTSKAGWGKMAADDLAERLEYNDELDTDDEDYEDEYVDYNGMRVRDILYANPHTALYEDAEDGDKALISNPYTHNMIVEGEPGEEKYYYLNDDGEKTALIEGDDGLFYKDKDKEEVFESHVLMLHNYVNSDVDKTEGTDGEQVYDYDSYGTAQTYTSASTVTLEPNTAAEISVWVKTSDLMFDRNGETPSEALGAFVTVTQTVGGNEIDEFTIDAINTAGVTDNNGWVQFTIFVQGCDFAASTVQVELGLGHAKDSDDFSETVEGYAFFDDLTCTLYPSMEDSENYNDAKDGGELDGTTCTLMSEADEKIFSYDDHKQDGYYYIDLASGSSKDATAIGSATVSAQLTEDDDHYVTSSKQPSFYGVTEKTAEKGLLNHNLDISTANDVVAAFDLADIAASIKSASSAVPGASKYTSRITDALESASALPGADENGKALMILSSRGAAYTANITGTEVDGKNTFTVGAEEYKIVSFWVKTSDMDGFSAATIRLYDVADDDTSASLAVDTTDVTFDVGDEKDIYNGWVQCFFFVSNPLEEEKTFAIDFSFGNSAIKDTTASSYKSGYAALTNIQTFDITDKDIFSLATTGTYAASFSFETTDNTSNNVMDEVYGALSNEIKNNLVSRPASYNGVNGASASVVYKDKVDSAGYDKRNGNEYAGLVNKEYFKNYLENASQDNSKFAWLEAVLDQPITAEVIANAEQIWNKLFGTETIQPLLIVNAVRTIGETAAMNYGFIADGSTTVASSGYQAITVRVKVSKGAVAYVYLTDPEDNTEISSFELPAYSFWYDSLGNVLDGEPDYDDDNYDTRDHVVYYLQDNGLYQDKEGKLFANMYNYTRQYTDEQASYYAKGASEATSFEDLDENTIYYISAEEAKKDDGVQSPHYLAATNSDGTATKVFSYFDGAYHYIISEKDDDGNVTISYSDPVENFDTSKAALRYDNTASGRQLSTVIDGRYDVNGKLFGGYDPNNLSADQLAKLGYDANGNYVADEWQTVTFFVHTGDESKSYNVELWSGKRDESGVSADGDGFVANKQTGSVPGSYVAFDYSNITVDSDSYTGLITEYTDNVIRKYVELFSSKGLLDKGTVAEAGKNIAYFEELFDGFVANGKLNEADRPTAYDAMYYTYSLYDDAGYIPYNADTAAEGETGYDYSADDYSETLVYLAYNDEGNNSTNVFVDFSATNVTVEKGTADSDEDTDDEETTNNTNVWLLVASILLAVALIFTLLSMLVRDLLKRKRKTRKHTERNVYAGKRKHYIRKLGLVEEAPADDGEGEANADVTEADVQPEESETQAPAEEQSADGEEQAPAEEQPEEGTEAAEADEAAPEQPAEEGAAESEGEKPEENK